VTPAPRGITDPEDLAWARARLAPYPIETMFDVPVITGRWRRVPRKHHVLAGVHRRLSSSSTTRRGHGKRDGQAL
jgi:hypothetical protein